MELCLNCLFVLEGEADIVGDINGGIFHQRVPVIQFKLGERVRQRLEVLKEDVNVGSLGLNPIQFCHYHLNALFGGFKALGQDVVAFLVFGLVKGDVSVFVNALLHHIENELCVSQKRGLFRFQLHGVKDKVYHLTAVGDDPGIVHQQLVCCR